MADKKLLVADDSLTIQKVIRLALSNEGYEIQTVSDGIETIEQLSLFQPDIVLIDVSLPGKSAFEVKSEFNRQQHLKSTKFILMSSAFEEVNEEEIEEAQFHGRLIKPFDPTNLRTVLNEVSNVVSEKVDSIETLPFSDPAEPPGTLPLSAPPEPPHTPPPPTKTEAPREDDNIDLDALPPFPNENQPTFSPDLWSTEGSDLDIQPPPIRGDDIKQLTETTIKMSGLDDFDWSVNEGGKLEPPPPKEEKVLHDEDTFSELKEIEPAIKPPKNLQEIDTTFPSIEEPIFESSNLPPPSTSISTPEPRVENLRPQTPVSSKEIEELVNNQLEEKIRKMAKKILPDIAERLIKEEINKMLSNPPNS